MSDITTREEVLLKQYLEKYRITQQEFADKLGSQRSTVTHIANGRPASFKYAREIEKITNGEVTFEELRNATR